MTAVNGLGAVRAMITPILGLPVPNEDLRWPRGYLVYGWDATSFGHLRACCGAVDAAGYPQTRKVRDSVIGSELRMFTGSPIGARSRWLAKAHPPEVIESLHTIRLVLDEEGTRFRSPLEHGFVLGWDHPVSSAFACCELVEGNLGHVFQTIRSTVRDQHLSHR